MKNATRLSIGVLSTAICCSVKCEDMREAQVGLQLAEVLSRLSSSASPEQYEQITSAISRSPSLSRELNHLCDAGILTEIQISDGVRTQNDVNTKYKGYISGSKIVLTSELLVELRKTRLYDVVRPDDILPNNTVFALAHLSHHLANSGALKPGSNDKDLMVWAHMRVKEEALTFIDSWNVMAEEAVIRANMQLSSAQIASLIVNCRYRFAFLGVRNKGIRGPSYLGDASIEKSDTNVDAIEKTLEEAAIADLE